MSKTDWVADVTVVDKPWGSEQHFALVDGRYCGKVLVIRAGQSLSLQYHELKDETIAVQSGSITLEIGLSTDRLESFNLEPGETVRVRPGTVHRMTAVVDSLVLEASTTELHDVIRLEDNYGRAGTTAAH
jgi:mannose-6-phosphate isomerase-like protein (cupin superfamily)